MQTWNAAVKSSSRVWQSVQILAALATFLGLIATVYFALDANKSKRIDVAYLAKLSLVNPTAASKDQIKVSYAGRDVHDLVQMSVRLFNGGALPIEKRDIELPISFRFSSGTILAAAIVRRVPENLQASIVTSGNGLVVNHGLLNPGDYIDFEVIADGDPGFPPPEFRIAGVSAARVSIPRDGRQVARPAYFSFSRGVELTILVVASCGPFLLTILSGGLVKLGCGDLWLPVTIRRIFRRAVITGSEDLRAVIADKLYQELPVGTDSRVRKRIEALKFDPSIEPASEFLARAEKTALEVISRKPIRERVDWPPLLVAIPGLLLAVALLLVIAGSWNSALHG